MIGIRRYKFSLNTCWLYHLAAMFFYRFSRWTLFINGWSVAITNAFLLCKMIRGFNKSGQWSIYVQGLKGGSYDFVMFFTTDDLRHQAENGERNDYYCTASPFMWGFIFFFAFLYSLSELVCRVRTWCHARWRDEKPFLTQPTLLPPPSSLCSQTFCILTLPSFQYVSCIIYLVNFSYFSLPSPPFSLLTVPSSWWWWWWW